MFGIKGFFRDGILFCEFFVKNFALCLHYDENNPDTKWYYDLAKTKYADTLGVLIQSFENLGASAPAPKLIDQINRKIFQTAVPILVTCFHANTLRIPHTKPVSTDFCSPLRLVYVLPPI